MGRWIDLLGHRNTASEPEERFILSIDGGGIRGIIPAIILARLAQDLKGLGDDRPLYSHFDLVAGTSTGALLSLGITLPGLGIRQEAGERTAVRHISRKGFFRKEEVLDGYIVRAGDPACLAGLYLDNAKKIFHQKGRLFGTVFADKYDAASLEDFLLASYGDVRLSAALVPCLAVAYDSLSGRAVVLSSYNEWKDMEARCAARASSAAPLYFPPFYTRDPEGRQAALLDGGLVANDPALVAYCEARRLYPHCSRFHILSLSTARGIYTFNPQEGLTGIAGWAEPVMKMYPSAQMSLVEQSLSCLPDVVYTRISGSVSREKIRLDDTRDESMRILVEGAGKLYEEKKAEIIAYLTRLASRTSLPGVRLEREDALSLTGN